MSERPVHEYIKELSEALVQLSDKVLQNFNEALYAVTHKDVQSARKIRIVDDEIDQTEVKLEERCLAFLALQQPVARDLRTMVTIIKINDDPSVSVTLPCTSSSVCQRLAMRLWSATSLKRWVTCRPPWSEKRSKLS